MDLVYTELKNVASQEIKVLRDANLIFIRPHVFKKGNPSGSLRINVKDQNGFLIERSSTVTIASISTFNFAHGYVRFDLTTPLKKDFIYQLELEAFAGYSFTESDHIGFCKDFDLRKVTANFSPNTGLNSALDLELWERVMGTRVVEFFDGFESNAAPTVGDILATGVNAFANDAAFETFVGRSAVDGDMYRNSTIGLLQIHDGASFEDIPIQDIPETQSDILNAEAGPTDVANLIVSSSVFHSVTLQYTLLRNTDTQETRETGKLTLEFNPDAAEWELARENDFDDTGVVLTVVPATGQVQYSSDDLTGADYEGFILFKTIKAFAPGV